MARAAQIAKSQSAPFGQGLPLLTAVVVLCAVVVGWLSADEDYLSPGSGTGYWLGIYGSVAMLSLLIYSLRKRYKAWRVIGSIPFWFRTHMILGVVGPMLILFHANFKLGPVNSNVALFSMLIVAFSGVVGKYIYGKVHVGLHGRKAQAKEILAEAEALKNSLGDEMQAAIFVHQELNAFSQSIKQSPGMGAMENLWAGAVLTVRARLMRAHLLSEAGRLIRIEGRASGWSWFERRQRQRQLSRVVRLYSAAVLKAAELAFYERLFALWHVLHLPLFFLMLLTGIVHVWAVHLY